MLADLFIAMLLGIIFGIFTGLTPGVHVNLVATAMLSIAPVLLAYVSPISLAVFLMSLAVTHSFLDTIPSTFLGAPESENALSVLPAQKLLLKGRGHDAVKLSILGTYCGLLVAVALAPLFIFAATKIQAWLKPYLIYFLAGVVIFMLLREKEKFWSALLFFMSGTLGVIVLSIKTLNEPLFPLLSGLFGVSGLLISYFENTKIPEQKFESEINLEQKELGKALSSSTAGVFLIQFFPGLGPAQGAVISSQMFKNPKPETYLVLIGAMGTMSVVFSLATFYALGNAKDGAIVVMSEIFQINAPSLTVLLLAFMTAGSIALILTLFFSRKFSKIIPRVNYKALVISIIIFIIAMAALFDGWLGMAILATSTALGLIAPLKGIPRSHAMGCLLLPVIFFLAL